MIFLTPHIVHGANDLAAVYQQKIQERDDFLEKIYGSNFKEDDFYKLLPEPGAGEFQADAFDVIDQQNRKIRMRSMMKDMGYSRDEIQQIEKKANEGASEDTGPDGPSKRAANDENQPANDDATDKG